MTIQVNGQQYIWRYTYLGFGKLADQFDDPYTYYHLYVPTNTTVVLKVVSQDVVHSWWMPDARRQGPGRARLHQLDLFQDHEARHLPGPVRVPLRARPRDDEGARDRRCRRTSGSLWLHALEKSLQANKNGGAAGRAALSKRTGSAAVENP